MLLGSTMLMKLPKKSSATSTSAWYWLDAVTPWARQLANRSIETMKFEISFPSWAIVLVSAGGRTTIERARMRCSSCVGFAGSCAPFSRTIKKALARSSICSCPLRAVPWCAVRKSVLQMPWSSSSARMFSGVATMLIVAFVFGLLTISYPMFSKNSAIMFSVTSPVRVRSRRKLSQYFMRCSFRYAVNYSNFAGYMLCKMEVMKCWQRKNQGKCTVVFY